MKRFFLFTFIAALVAGAGWWFFLHRDSQGDDPGIKPQTTEVTRRSIEEKVVTTGILRPASSSEVRSEVSGRVVKLFIREGEIMQAGQPLLELDQSQLKSDIQAAELAIELARLDAEKLKADLRRQEQLRNSNLVTEKAYTDTRADAGKAKIEVRIQQAKLDRLKTELAKTTILAPIQGAVLDLAAREGMVITGASSVSEGTVLMEIAELDRLNVESDVNEIDVAKLKEGMAVTVTFDSKPDLKADGQLSFIAPSATELPNQANNQNQARTFQIIASLKVTDGGVKPGMSANLSILVDKAEEALTLPISAIFMEEGKAYVYKQHNPEQRVPVELGISDARHIVLDSGVEEGEVIMLERPASSPTPDRERRRD